MSEPGALDLQSQAVVNALNASGALPFSQFEPAEVRAKILSLRVQRPPNSTLEMTSSDETLTTADGTCVGSPRTQRDSASTETKSCWRATAQAAI